MSATGTQFQRSLEEERKMDKRGDKSQFSLTCSRLNHYLKQNGTFPDLLQSKGNFFAPALTASLQVSGNHQPCHAETTTTSMVEVASKSDTKETGKGSQLTIFYSGKVVVFDDFPENKVKDLVLLASKYCTAETAADSVSTKSNQGLERHPYHVHGGLSEVQSGDEKQEEGQPWLSLAPQSTKRDRSHTAH